MNTTRRRLLNAATAGGALALLPGLIREALAQAPGLPANSAIRPQVQLPSNVKLRQLPPVRFTPPSAGDGAAGPWGEVIVTRGREGALPAFAQSLNRRGTIAFAARKPNIELGTGTAGSIVLTSAGITYGGGTRPVPWSAAAVQRLVKTISADPEKAQALMQLRSTLITAYPVARAQAKGTDRSVGAAVGRMAAGTQPRRCTTERIEEVAERTVTETVELWKTAEQRFSECMEFELSGNPNNACTYAGPQEAKLACAAAACTAKGFVDVVVGMMEVVRTVTELVVREVVTCVPLAVPGRLPNPFNLVDKVLPGVEQSTSAAAKPPVTMKDVQEAIKLVEKHAGFLGPLGRCFMAGAWSIAGVETPIPMGDGRFAVPYGIRVELSAACAERLTIAGLGHELAESWTAALGLMAAFDPNFAVVASSLGVPKAVVGAIAASAAAQAAATIILGFLLLSLWHGTLIVGQISLAKELGKLDDGKCTLTHASFALTMVKLMTLGIAPAELVPPLVDDLMR
jgi:hypothetical protein